MSGTKKFTREEVRTTSGGTEKAVFIIDNAVYDVSKFLDEHPGGHEVLLNAVGRDASEDFDDVGHSIDAKELMIKYRVGEIVEGERKETKQRQVNWTPQSETESDSSGFLSSWKVPLVVSVVLTLLYTYLFG